MAEKPADARDGKEGEMVYACRIDDIVTLPDGRIEVKLTEGLSPLPNEPSGDGFVVANEQELRDNIIQAELRMQPEVKWVRLGRAYKADPEMGATFKTNAKDLSPAKLDLTGTAGTVTP